MALLNLTESEYIDRYGPTPIYTPEGGWVSGEPDKLVKTHCCFCGVQCGIQLKVKENDLKEQAESKQDIIDNKSDEPDYFDLMLEKIGF